MGYSTLSNSPKALVKSEDIGNGQIELRHLAPGLFAQMQKINLHSHSGTGSRRVKLIDLEGAFGKNGFIMYSNDGTKRYRITINNSGTLLASELT